MGFVRRKANPNSYYKQLTPLKKLIWLYLVLLFFEGALRKWVTPGLTAELLVIRDPVGVLIIWEAYRSRRWPSRWNLVLFVFSAGIVTVFVLQTALGDSSLLAGIYGLRSYLLPFPVLFIIGECLDRKDLQKMGVFTLWCLLINAPLAVAQYIFPSQSLFNNGAYQGAAQIGFVGLHVRASGTFSFVIGLVHFATLAGIFLLYGMVEKGFAKNWTLWASALALVIVVPATGQRILLVQLGLVLVCMGIAALMGVSQFARVLRIILPVALAVLVATRLPVFSEEMQSLSQRLTGGAQSGLTESTIYERAVAPVFGAVEDAFSGSNPLGNGMGTLASAARALMSPGNAEAAGSDNELAREIEEMGIAGVGYVLFKLFLVVALLGPALAKAREHEPLALLMFPLALGTLLFGVAEQPTEQGFMVISAAFCIAASKVAHDAAQEAVPLPPAVTRALYHRRLRPADPRQRLFPSPNRGLRPGRPAGPISNE